MTAVAAEKQEAGGALRRIMMVVAVSVLMAVMAAPAFAVKGGFANDDKNNPTSPGIGLGRDSGYLEQAVQNQGENWFKQEAKGHTPAQCV